MQTPEQPQSVPRRNNNNLPQHVNTLFFITPTIRKKKNQKKIKGEYDVIYGDTIVNNNEFNYK